MKDRVSYFARLRFDKKLEKGIIFFYYSNPRLLVLFLLAIIILGIYSFLQLPRLLNPQIKIPIVIVSTILPGGSPNDIEALLTIPLEEAISGTDNIKTVLSSSSNSVSAISVEFESGIDPEKARDDIQSAVDTISSLPQEAQSPKVQILDFADEPVWTFSLTAKDSASLQKHGRKLQNALKSLSEVDRVELSGFEEKEIQVLIKPEAISSYQINPIMLSQLITAATTSYPLGSIRTETSSFSLAIDPAVTNIAEIRDLQISIDGRTQPLSNIAQIFEKSKPEERSSFIASHNNTSTQAIKFSVFKVASVNTDKAYIAIKQRVDQLISNNASTLNVFSIINSSEAVDDQFNELTRDFSITLTLVFITILIFLGLRQALVASLSIPLTFLVTFIVMNITGITLNFISFFSLLLVLGLIVDDTIVVISAMAAYFRTGKFTPRETGLLVFRDFIVAISTTTITTVWAFIPLLLSTGIIGEFIKPIPIVVSTSLLSSLVVAMFITLPFIIFLLNPTIPRRVIIFINISIIVIVISLFLYLAPKGVLFVPQVIAFVVFSLLFAYLRNRLTGRIVQAARPHKNHRKHDKPSYYRNLITHGLISFETISKHYAYAIDKILSSRINRRNAIIMVIIFSIFSYLLLPLGFVKNEFFPESDQDFLFISVVLPAGTYLKATTSEANSLLNDIRVLEGVDYAVADIGQTFSTTGGIGSTDTNTFLITLLLKDEHERSLTSIELAKMIREKYASYPKGEFSVVEASGGPPAGADLQIKLFGEDLATLDESAEKIIAYLKNQNGVTNTLKSIKPGTGKIVFVPDKHKLAQRNITYDLLGLWLRSYASGFKLDTINLPDNNNEITDITLRLNPGTLYAKDLSLLSIITPSGPIPLTLLGTFVLKSNPTLISREDGKRTISVTASVTSGFSVSTLNQNLENFADTTLSLPTGYFWKTGGVNEENQRSVNSILLAMILSFFLIVVTMVIQFSSFRKALIVMLVIPLSISGVFIIFALTKTPLSFPALIGVLALFGIVVKNAILVVDKINQNNSAGLPFKDAIIDASASRLEAIGLTSFAAIVGLIPITLSDPIWRGLGGAIIAGLAFSGTIMLFFIPVVYYYWFEPPKVEKRKRLITRR